MYKRDELIAHLDNFTNEATANGYDADFLQPLSMLLLESIEDYYSTPLEARVRRCIEALAHEIRRAYMQGRDTETIAGTRNITALFNAPALFMNTTISDLIGSLEEETDEITGLVTAYRSTLIESIVNALDIEADALPDSFLSIAIEAESAFQLDSVQVLFEPPTIHAVPNTADIAKIIFIDCGYLELINAYELNIFVPSEVKP